VADPANAPDAKTGAFDEKSEAAASRSDPDRRSFFSATATLAMAGGLASSYGTFFVMAGRYFFPSSDNKTWLFVSNAKGIELGSSLDFESPTGVKVSITRNSEASEGKDGNVSDPTAEDFLALSSVCPHLGCRVHWEAHNNRFFCPCHNGVFDPSGKATGGPPAADGQNLSRYPLKIVNGALYIEMPFRSV